MDSDNSMPSIEEMKRIRKYYSRGNDLQTLVDIAGMTANCLESGKLVFVVRCKDCKHWIGNWCNEGYSPTVKCTLFHYPQPADWYCADGERKE